INKKDAEQYTLSKQKTRGLILILGFLSALGPFSIDMYLPSFPSIAKDFNTDISQVGLSLTSYFVGISLGQIIYGPILDKFGRKKPLLIGLAIYLISAIGCALSPSLNFLIGMRFISALGGCVGMVAGRAIVRDLFPASEIPHVFSLLMLVMGIAPIIAPTTGGLIIYFLDWRYIFFLLAVITTVMITCVSLFLPESKTPDHTISLKIKNIFKEYFSILKDKTFRNYSLAGSLAMSGMFAYIAGSPLVYIKLFGLSEQTYAIFFGLNAMSFIIGSQLNRFALNRIETKNVILLANLFQLSGTTLLLLGALSGFIGMTGTIILILNHMFWLGFFNPNVSAFALIPFKKNAGSASALSGSIQMIFSALITGLVSYFQNGTSIQMISV
ncbi:MAG: multidrug effflux MFS transporter, partial [Candidatus Sericytochromatia bacterium]